MRFLHHYCLLFLIVMHSTPTFVTSQHLLDVILSQAVRQDPLSQAIYLFAIDLYKKVLKSDKDGTILFSPTSIYVSLATLYAGSEGETKKQLSSALHLDKFKSETEFYETIGQLLENMETSWSKNVLQMETYLFGPNRVPFKPAYFRKMKDYFQAVDDLPIDFDYSKLRKCNRDEINDWVFAATWGNIFDLLPEDAITNDTAFALANVVHFKGSWLYAFEKKETRYETFTDPTNQKLDVPMMHQTMPKGIRYLKSKKKAFSLIELPFSANEVSMVYVLDERRALGSYLSSEIVDTPWDQDFNVFTDVSVHVALPGFSLKQTMNLRKVLQVFGVTNGSLKLGLKHSMNPKETLQTYGVKDVFDSAELTGIADSGPLRLSDAYHKASIKVDQYGADAAGATVLGLTMKPVASSTKQTYNVTLDRPFLFLVIDKTSGCVLFLGHFKNPLYF